MPDWSAEQYLKFELQRTQPAVDLANRIGPIQPADILDVGCGPGNSTQVLARFFPQTEILGVDNSQNMIDAARASYPALSFQLCDARSQLAEIGRQFDVVFANACIQWIPNHPALLREMMSLLRQDGVLAVQTPMNYEEPIHRIITRIVAGPPWAGKILSPRVFYNLPAAEYFDILSEIASDFTLWQTTYYHRMQSHGEIMEWYRGTGLRPYLEVLSAEEQIAFEEEVYAEVVKAYPCRRNGEVIFRFPRLFFVAVK